MRKFRFVGDCFVGLNEKKRKETKPDMGVCTKCNYRIKTSENEVRYCKNYVSCKKGCVSRCWLHTSPLKQRCDADKQKGRVVVIMMAYNGVSVPYIWEKWRDALGPKRSESIKFLLHVDNPPRGAPERGVEFTKRYKTEWTSIENLDGSRGDFKFVATTLMVLCEAMIRFPRSTHFCIVTGDTAPICEPQKLLGLDKNKSYISHSFVCLDRGGDTQKVQQLTYYLYQNLKFVVPPVQNWDKTEDNFGFGLLNHHRDMILSRDHAKKVIDFLAGPNVVPLENRVSINFFMATLQPFGSLDEDLTADYKQLLYANPDEYAIGNVLAMALGRAEFKKQVTNTNIVAFIKYWTRDNGMLSKRSRTFNAVSKNHPALRMALIEILENLREGKSVPNLRPANMKNVLFFRKLGPRMNQTKFLTISSLADQITMELWPELGVTDLDDDQDGDDSDDSSDVSVSSISESSSSSSSSEESD
jgi:hypothetical protein